MLTKLRYRLIEMLGGVAPDEDFDAAQHVTLENENLSLNDPGSSYGNDSDKKQFVERMKKMTKQAAIDLVNMMEKTGNSPGLNVIRYQIIKSATSTAANYRAACIARSRKEFFAKICIVTEECDETEFWLEMLYETEIKLDKEKIENMLPVWNEILRIVSKAKKSSSPH